MNLQTIVGGDEVSEVLTELVVTVVVEALDGRIFDRAVHLFDLTVSPWMFLLGGAVFYVGMAPRPTQTSMRQDAPA